MDPSRNVEAHATSESGIFQSVNWDTTCRWQVGFKLWLVISCDVSLLNQKSLDWRMDEWRDGWMDGDGQVGWKISWFMFWLTSRDIGWHHECIWIYECQTDCQTVSLPSCPSNSMILAPLSLAGRFAASKTTAFWGYNSFLMVPQRPTTSTLDGALRATLFFLYYLLILTKDDAVIFFVPRVCVLLTLLAVQEALQKCEALESLLADERMRLMSRVEEARSCREREDTILGRCPFIGNIQGRVIFHWGKWQLQEEEGWGWRSNPYTIFIWFHHGDGWESQFNNQTLRFPKLLPKWDKSSPWQLGQLQRNNIKLTYMTSYDRSLSWRMVANGTNRSNRNE